MLYERPVRELLRDGIDAMPETFTRDDLQEWFRLNYPRVNSTTVYLHMQAGVANNKRQYRSRVGDLLWRRSDGRYEQFDPAKHGPGHTVARPRRSKEQVDRADAEPTMVAAALSPPVLDSLGEVFGCSFEPEILQLRGGGKHEFDLASDDEAMVGIHVPLGRFPDPRARFALLAEATWLLQGLTKTASRFVLVTEERKVAHLWLEQYSALALGIEFFLLDGEHVVDLREGLA